MIFLRVVRVVLIVLGVGVAAFGVIGIGVDARMSGGPITASWSCTSGGSGASARMTCKTNSATYAGPGGLVDTIGYLGLTIGGIALIGAAVAIGQFDRTRIAAPPAPGPMGMPSGPPFPPPNHGPQPHGPQPHGPQPGHGHPGSW